MTERVTERAPRRLPRACGGNLGPYAGGTRSQASASCARGGWLSGKRIAARLQLYVLIWLGMAACTGGGQAHGSATLAGAHVLPTLPSAIDRIIDLVPGQPELVIEIDVARLRATRSVAPLLARLWQAPAGSAVESSAVARFAAPLTPQGAVTASRASEIAWRDVDALVMCAYALGTPQAQTLFLLAAPATAIAPSVGAVELASGQWAVGPEGVVAQALSEIADPSGAAASPWRRARHAAWPAGAQAAAVSVHAQLAAPAWQAVWQTLWHASPALASDTGETREPLTAVARRPVVASLWFDIEDDAALVLQLAAPPDDAAAASEMGRAVVTLLQRWRNLELVQQLGLISVLRTARVATRGPVARVEMVVPPQLWQRTVARLTRALPPVVAH